MQDDERHKMPHIVNFVAQKFNLDKDTLYKDLRKCHVGDARQDAATVINGIKEAGGVAVWAHPLGGEGEPILTQAEFLSRSVNWEQNRPS